MNIVDPNSVYITQNAAYKLSFNSIGVALHRFNQKDWGDVAQEDWEENDRALEQGGRILATYRDRNNTEFWVIREADGKTTTVLLPEDY